MSENAGNTENVRNVAAKEGVCSLENEVNTENSTEMAGMEYAENTDSSENSGPFYWRLPWCLPQQSETSDQSLWQQMMIRL